MKIKIDLEKLNKTVKINPKQIALIINEYKEANGLTTEDFYTEFKNAGGDISLDTLKKWLSNNAPDSIKRENLKALLELLQIDLQRVLPLSNLKRDIELINIPLYSDIYASAGTGIINFEECEKTMLHFTRDELKERFGVAFGYSKIGMIKVKGVSMEPKIPDKSIIVFKSDEPVKYDSTFVIRFGDELFVKNVDTINKKLISYNKDFPPIEYTDFDVESGKIVFIGKVISFYNIVILD